MKSFSWEFINNEEVTKDLDYSCFEHNTSTIDKNFYSFFNLDAENKNKVNILLIDSSGNKHTSYIRHVSESREASPVKLIKWNKSFTDHLKKEFPNWEEVKKGEKTENYKLVFKKTDESNTYNISTKEVTIQQLTDFTDLLISKGINPKEVQLIRHLSKVQKNMNETYYWLWKENPKAFFEANSWQSKDKFKDRKFLSVFLPTPTKDTLFVKFYNILSQDEKSIEGKVGHYYNLEPNDLFAEYEGRLKIDWGVGAEKAWAQVAGNTPKVIISDGKIKSFGELIPGKSYIRKELREAFGGNRQRGIVTLPRHNAIFLMPSRKNKDIGYEARWDDGVYYLSGEGLIGDQKLTVGNKALKESIGTDKPIYLFEPLLNKVPYTHIFHSQVKCIDFEEYRGPDKDGNLRKMYRFYFKSSEHPDFQDVGYSKIIDEVREEIEEDHIKKSISETSVSTKERKLSTKAYETARKEAVTRQQLENKLVADYINYLSDRGYETKHSQVDLIAEKNGRTIYVEAKILKGPTTAAHGLGQILHYDFILDKKADELALLFDRKPNEQTINFIKQYSVGIIYKDKETFKKI